jgi:hypothetical protein
MTEIDAFLMICVLLLLFGGVFSMGRINILSDRVKQLSDWKQSHIREHWDVITDDDFQYTMLQETVRYLMVEQSKNTIDKDKNIGK